jgi:hypothetical protein
MQPRLSLKGKLQLWMIGRDSSNKFIGFPTFDRGEIAGNVRSVQVRL